MCHRHNMALITISGYPSSGKSTRATQIQNFISNKDPLLNVSIISDHSLGLSPSEYSQSSSEKSARASLFAAVQRHMAVDTILIVDSLNYIKGFRYQLYCAARELKLRTCTVFVVASPDLCREWNASRQTSSMYDSTTLENLIVRFEEPSSMVRWDAPLFTVLWNDEDVPGIQIWEAITQGSLKPPNSGTLAVAKAPADALNILEKTTTAIVSNIISNSSQSNGGSIPIFIGQNVKQCITLPPRNITLSELQRLKRQFVIVHKKVITLGSIERGTVNWEEESITKKFIEFIEEHLKS